MVSMAGSPVGAVEEAPDGLGVHAGEKLLLADPVRSDARILGEREIRLFWTATEEIQRRLGIEIPVAGRDEPASDLREAEHPQDAKRRSPSGDAPTASTGMLPAIPTFAPPAQPAASTPSRAAAWIASRRLRAGS